MSGAPLQNGSKRARCEVCRASAGRNKKSDYRWYLRICKILPQLPKAGAVRGSEKNKNIKSYLDEYLTICQNRNLSPSTIKGYEKCLSALSALHKFHVSELTPAVLKNWIASRKTKLKTIRNNLSFLRSAIDEAVTDGLLTINPVTLVSASRYHVLDNTPGSDDYEVDPFTPAETAAIYDACHYPEWQNLFRFAFNTGLRSSELCALRWTDIDFIGNTAHVQTASVVGVIKSTKTKAGTRKVQLNNEALVALQAQKPYTALKSDFIFSDPKTRAPWANADAIRKKPGYRPLKRLVYVIAIRTRHAIRSPLGTLARALTCSGWLVRWGTKDRKCCSDITALTLQNTMEKRRFLQPGNGKIFQNIVQNQDVTGTTICT